MFPKQYCIKKAWLLFTLILVSAFVHAQQGRQDTLRRLMQRIVTDSLPDPPPEISYEEEDSNGSNIYFVQKTMQANGGGPDSISWKKIPDTVIQKLQADDDFWYINYVFNKQKREKKQYEYEERNVPLAETSLFQTILWLVIIGGFIAFVIIYLANSNTGLFRKKNTIIRSDEEMEAETDNIFEINYQREIDRAVSNGNYRFAVRLMFLRVLKNLSDKNIIQYTPDRTNFDYLLQLHDTYHYNDFFKLTRNYEYSWYGQFDIDTENFSWIRRDFENFDHKLK
jgi:hypothetical protein